MSTSRELDDVVVVREPKRSVSEQGIAYSNFLPLDEVPVLTRVEAPSDHNSSAPYPSRQGKHWNRPFIDHR